MRARNQKTHCATFGSSEDQDPEDPLPQSQSALKKTPARGARAAAAASSKGAFASLSEDQDPEEPFGEFEEDPFGVLEDPPRIFFSF